jgi:hypothetical protein
MFCICSSDRVDVHRPLARKICLLANDQAMSRSKKVPILQINFKLNARSSVRPIFQILNLKFVYPVSLEKT